MGKLIYLDNAATSFPKPREVMREVMRLMRYHCANPGRSTHAMSAWCAEKVYDTRELIASFLNFPHPERVVFTHNATHALNLAIKGKIRNKCHIITSDIEHNSVLRPLYKQAKETESEISIYDSDLPLREAILPLIRNDSRYIVSSLASNVTGKVIDPFELSAIAREHGLYTIIDISQYVGHVPLDLTLSPFDIVCAPAHKALFGLQGGGFAVLRNPEELYTILEGGSGADTFNIEMPKAPPERYEAGTLNMPAIVSLAAGIEHLKSLTMECVHERIQILTARLSETLENTKARVFGCDNGIASFEMPGISTHKLATYLDDCMIASRGGLHCAPLIHKKLGTYEGGTVRVSLSIMNSFDDIDALYKALSCV